MKIVVSCSPNNNYNKTSGLEMEDTGKEIRSVRHRDG